MRNIYEKLRTNWKLTGLVIGALLLGSAAGASSTGEATEELTAAEADLDQLTQELESSEDDKAQLVSERDALEAELSTYQDELSELEAEHESVTRNLTKLEKELKAKIDKVDSELADVQALKKSLTKEEAAARSLRRKLDKELSLVKKSKFGDGVWRVGTEVPPGIYRSPAGSSCYWAILASADTSDINNNGGFSANQVVTLSAGQWFETSGCGQWTKIG